MFKMIRANVADRRMETYCDDSMHIELTYPAHLYSGEPTGIDLNKCDCLKEENPA